MQNNIKTKTQQQQQQSNSNHNMSMSKQHTYSMGRTFRATRAWSSTPSQIWHLPEREKRKRQQMLKTQKTKKYEAKKLSKRDKQTNTK